METIEDITELEINEDILADLSWLFYEYGPIPINSYGMQSGKSEKKLCDQHECDTKFGFFDTKRQCNRCGMVFCSKHPTEMFKFLLWPKPLLVCGNCGKELNAVYRPHVRYIEIIEKIASIIDDRKGQLLKQALSSTNNVYGVATQEGVHFLQQSAVAVATRAGIRGALMEFVTRTEAAAAAGVSAAIAAPIAVGVQAACSGVEVNFEANAVYKSIKKYEEGEKDIIELRIDMAAEGGRFIFGSGGAVAGAAAGGAIFSAILPGVGTAAGIIIGALLGGIISGILSASLGTGAYYGIQLLAAKLLRNLREACPTEQTIEEKHHLYVYLLTTLSKEKMIRTIKILSEELGQNPHQLGADVLASAWSSGISSALRTLLRETQVIVLCNRNWGSKQSRSDYCLHAGSENNEIVENAKTEFGEKHLEQIVSLPEFENALLALADADNVLESTNFLTAIKSCVEELNKAIGGVNGATPGADQFATMLEYCVYKNAPVTLHSQVVTVDNALNSNENIGLGNDEDKWVAATLFTFESINMNDHVQKAARQLNSPADLDLMSNPTVCGTQQKGAEIKLEALKDKQLKRLIDYKRVVVGSIMQRQHDRIKQELANPENLQHSKKWKKSRYWHWKKLNFDAASLKESPAVKNAMKALNDIPFPAKLQEIFGATLTRLHSEETEDKLQ